MGDTIDRSYSNSEIDYSMRNRNVDWMTLPFVTLSYIVGILTVWGVLHMSRYFSAEDCWTVTNVLHGVVSFILTNNMHRVSSVFIIYRYHLFYYTGLKDVLMILIKESLMHLRYGSK